MTIKASTTTRFRSALKIHGIVQGVGFRPTVYRLAVEQGLAGFVRNEPDGVAIEIEGDEPVVRSFERLLKTNLPVAARIDAIEIRELSALNEMSFRVASSLDAAGLDFTHVPADRATCDDCVREMFDPEDRRYLYPFITCTNCGPRFTIVQSLPYDRARTTMSQFTMCVACRSEYEDPRDRRFHSETNCCANCGPRLASPIEDALKSLRDGQIVAVKGIGGFHLAVDARNEDAISRLRHRKRRPHKPFAVMVRDLETAGQFVELSTMAGQTLLDSARPVVCLPKRAELAPSVAPGLNEIGVMLPYAPLHHLLLRDRLSVLVMTSGNRVDEPIAVDNDEAIERLSTIADVFLFHDRPIHARADDSVVRVVESTVQPVRRSRGIVPDTITLPFSARSVLAVGAQLKNTVCVTRGDQAHLSAHIGDLSDPRSLSYFEKTVETMTGLAGSPVAVAHDMHPDYQSTRWALQSGFPLIPVQHHHAHIASCLADNGRTDRVIGVAFDGTGCGPEGELWGGEILVCDLEAFTRAGYLRSIALPGGEAAIREPWRLAAAALLDAGEHLDILERIGSSRLDSIRDLIERGLRSPVATSAGRWFDAVSSLLGVCDSVSYEGQAAMELESITGLPDRAYPFSVTPENEIDLRPMVKAIATDVRARVDAGPIASRFHETLVRGIEEVCARLPQRKVALSGGCFQNRRLVERTKEVLELRGFEVLLHQRVPCNDGGIAFGQAAVAAWRLREPVD